MIVIVIVKVLAVVVFHVTIGGPSYGASSSHQLLAWLWYPFDMAAAATVVSHNFRTTMSPRKPYCWCKWYPERMSSSPKVKKQKADCVTKLELSLCDGGVCLGSRHCTWLTQYSDRFSELLAFFRSAEIAFPRDRPVEPFLTSLLPKVKGEVEG